jgi:predicted phage tail protein|tara:strand:- start:5520 stop:6236 length:717 start_codon:yes stop_codon:yes gene_type:complete
MMRNVYLEGEMGEKFGTGFQVNAPKVSDVLRCIDCNHPSFKQYLIKCHEENIGFEVDIANSKIDYVEELLMNLQDGDVTITPLPAGSKSGGGKILAAIALIALAVAMPALLTTTGSVTLGGGVGASAATVGTSYVGTFMGLSAGSIQLGLGALAVNLGMAGIMQMMAPDPATDGDQEQNYLFNGNQQNIVEGDPVPVLYGRLRVPGQPVNFEVAGVQSNVYRTAYMTRDGASQIGSAG